MAEKEQASVGRALKLLALLMATLVSPLLLAFVGRQLWEWFFVIHGLPHLGFANVYGGAALISLICKSTDMETPEQSIAKTALLPLIKPAIAFLSGWIAHLFM